MLKLDTESVYKMFYGYKGKLWKKLSLFFEERRWNMLALIAHYGAVVESLDYMAGILSRKRAVRRRD